MLFFTSESRSIYQSHALSVSDIGPITNKCPDSDEHQVTAKSLMTAHRTVTDSSSEFSDDSDSILNPVVCQSLSTSVLADAVDGENANVDTQSSFIEIDDLICKTAVNQATINVPNPPTERKRRRISEDMSSSSSDDNRSVHRPCKRVKSSKPTDGHNAEHSREVPSSDDDLLPSFSLENVKNGTVDGNANRLLSAGDGKMVGNNLTVSEHELKRMNKSEENSGLQNGDCKRIIVSGKFNRQYAGKRRQSKRIMSEGRGM